MTEKKDLYQEAGVDVAKGDSLVGWLQKDSSQDQHRFGEIVSGIGGFSGLFRPNFGTMKDPLLVTGTDGVGTKVLLGLESDQLEGLGQDLVGMCVNDLYTIGGYPLFFLDYYATGVLDESQFKRILSGIRKGLKLSDCLLLGGETAELPGLYEKGHFDLAGFVVGVVDGETRLRPEWVKPGDALVSFASSGFHSNGYSLVRKWLKENPVDDKLLEKIMEPTKIYGEIPKIIEGLPRQSFHALANITGGGISGNLPRVLPDNVVAVIERKKVPVPDWMMGFCEQNGASFDEVEGVFNMGAGMIAAVDAGQVDKLLELAQSMGLPACEIGTIKSATGKASVQYT
ncbi:phosphoribosylformylglycinamidine cyclo-ligase [Pseudobacteriovorax antillogorgiicola]|uniref:Phosphoribosylformylglycinamidine cyclo-ligase n=1 Tax=Pseudobacteriovorax antillogorgiicola TaxID=1513793 RepID=A0A1Y6CL28_9BACT|nr:phosphoribosylformylglycinamidine cyclo-ligase [Pseudobacteriovorax antillogorgiicola]TCS46176.1 phosphoribosylformylglycinamidine cyclo-ligase [Pseudobacteriovorax antillogorgiicola]SMF70010.1 phosphoribosylformylglycinamidine cyclo-ligase [Pseudobacteriovorax antillogorgiicola]